MKVRYSRPASIDLDTICSYISQHSPQGAERVQARIRANVELLGDFPDMARVTNRHGVRVLVVTPYPYLVFYRVHADEVEILHIRHAARRTWSEE